MIAELGQLALILALAMAIVQCVVPLAGAARGNPDWMALARPAAIGQFLFVATAFACLTMSFVNNDFSVLYVAQHSNSALPLIYRICAVWGGHEGSILLWALILASWTLAVSLFSNNLDDQTTARIIGVIGLISIGFLLFILFTSNPFERLIPAAADGQDLNPQLQDPGLIIHPPLLYMGYVGTVVAFAFAIAALLAGRLDAAWARWSRPWATVSWGFLTLGIAVGSAWAYYELGWGGWWFWDPVENASLMPWLVSTALLHSLAVTEKRNTFKLWTALLAIIAFSLSLLGTFLVRSGVLTSVHAFATDPSRGIYILGFLTLVVGGSLVLFAWRAPKVGLGARFGMVSREAMLLVNNVVLLVAFTAVLLGTLYPLLIDALGMGKLSVGPPYFNAVFVPLMAPALFLMGIGPIARWREDKAMALALKLRWALGVSLVAALISPWLLGNWKPLVGFGLFLAFWIATTTVYNLYERLKSHPAPSWRRRISMQPGSYYGMLLAHLGVAIFIVGVTIVNGYEVEKDVTMEPGETTSIAGYTFQFEGTSRKQGPNYTADVGILTVTSNGKPVTTLKPERRIYTASRNPMPMTEAAINPGLTRDLYAALGDQLTDKRWIVRVYFKPFVDWIWFGCLIMALGGLFAVMDRRYRIARRTQRTRASQAPQGVPATATARMVSP
ncbi:MAG: c-type cytochrome biogenesis protein CcmF [Burkholderiales bacterium 66-5]|uniref:heme lyase CcmF/NrfE family subunit n=1 Tax=Comamonas badia TaxID=265291 RepID=UPI00040711EA|nr:heme lyase CcmF/NrfE family subunit [Comamonas badia]OJU89891.1 MAG: c-type cytochrome biogenesis protein CcmF [Burkholderiales bacterium 66-5]